MPRRLTLLLLSAVLALAAPVPGWAAPDSPPADAAEAPPSDRELAEGLFLSTAKLTAPKKPGCGEPGKNGEIVVCGADRGERWRVPGETDPNAPGAQNTGGARAPNVSSLPDCSRGCLHLGKKQQPLHIIDFSKLPIAPAGSDADKIAKGEMPAP